MTGRALLVVVVGMLMAVAALGVGSRVFMAVAGSVARATLHAVQASVSTAHAEDLQFQEVSADSTPSARRRARRTASSSSVPAPPAAVPAPPVPPTPPVAEAPSVIIGKTGDIMRVGSDVTVGKDDVVTGDVLAVGGDLTVKGHVEGNAVSMGGDIYLESTARVDGDVVCVAGELHEEPGAVVGGKRVVGLKGKESRSGSDDSDAGITIDVDEDRHRDRGRKDDDLVEALAWLLVWLLIGWAIAKIAPGRTVAALDSFRRGPGTSFLVGWLALVLTIPGLIAVALLTALLCITIIGIPLGIAVLFGYFLFLGVFLIWGAVVGSAVVGEWFARRRGIANPSLVRVIVTGVLVTEGAMVVTSLLQVLPVLSGFGKFLWVLALIANILISVAGWGALLYSEFTTGWIARWWNGRRSPPPPPAAPAPAPFEPTPGGSGTSVTSVPMPGPGVSAAAPAIVTPPPPPPSPPASFMPPAEGSPPPASGT